MLLCADAEATLPLLRQLGERVVSQLPSSFSVRPTVAPLKGLARAALKCLEKYGGNYNRLCDLVRMTFECQRLQEVLLVLEALAACPAEWALLRVKNRLMPAFNADETGGRRMKTTAPDRWRHASTHCKPHCHRTRAPLVVVGAIR